MPCGNGGFDCKDHETTSIPTSISTSLPVRSGNEINMSRRKSSGATDDGHSVGGTIAGVLVGFLVLTTIAVVCWHRNKKTAGTKEALGGQNNELTAHHMEIVGLPAASPFHNEDGIQMTIEPTEEAQVPPQLHDGNIEVEVELQATPNSNGTPGPNPPTTVTHQVSV